MNRKILFIVFLIVAVKAFSQELIPYRVGNLWGFSDAKEKLILQAKYDSVTPFEYHKFFKKYYAIVREDDKMTLIDEKGNNLLSHLNIAIKNIDLAWGDSNIIAVEDAHGKHQIYNILKKQLYNKQLETYKFLGPFDLIMIEKDGKIGLIDEQFATVANIEYDQIGVKKFNDNNRITKFEEKLLKKVGVSYIKEAPYFPFLNEKQEPFKEPFAVITLVNQKETKSILFKIPPYEYVEDPERDTYISITSNNESRYTNNREDAKFSEFKFYECYSTSEDCRYTIYHEGKIKHGVYNFKKQQSSKLYDRVRGRQRSIDYIIVKDGLKGVLQGDLEVVLAPKFEEIRSLSYDMSILTIQKVKTRGYDTEKYRYDYYDPKTKKYLLKDAQYFYNMGYARSIKKPKKYHYFRVLKNGLYFYMGEDGRIFYKK
jgi:hypothetical protein